MDWKLVVRPLAPFPEDENPQKLAKAHFEIGKALARHRLTWGPDHAKVIKREDIENAVRNNPDLQIGAFLVGPNPHSGRTNERLLGVVTVARFNPRHVPLDSPYDVIRLQHDPNGKAISCFIVSVKHRRPPGVHREDIIRLGARIDGIVVGGRPNSENLTGAGALVRMSYPLH